MLFSDSANIPEIDLTFALSATSVSSETTFNLMKSTVNRIVQQYGIERIHYSVIVFGSVSTTRFDFSRTFPDKDSLIRTVSRLPKNPGNSDLAKALESAKRVYELQQVRPHAKKVLVVIMDNKSTNSITELNKIVPVLVDKGVLVIGVGVGGSVESKELEIITEENRNIIKVGISKNPDELAKEIMAIILRSESISFISHDVLSVCCGCYCCLLACFFICFFFVLSVRFREGKNDRSSLLQYLAKPLLIVSNNFAVA